MTTRGAGGATLPAALALALASCAAPRIVLVRGGDGVRDAFEVRGLDPGFLSRSAEAETDWKGVFEVFVDLPAGPSGQELPPVLGSTSLQGAVLRFEPRFPLEPGLRYRARFSPGPRTGQGRGEGAALEEVFALAPRRIEPTTVVSRVYPSAWWLPQNQLKFYIHFSGPMRRRQAYERVHLLDSNGREVEAPFLEIGEELWDPSGTRFTLFFDPGRVKRGLKPNEEVGPPLEAGRRYALLIDAAWLDASGAPLREPFRKDFEVGPPDYEPPDPAAWKLAAPAAGTSGPFKVVFPEPLEHALLHRLLQVRGPTGEALAGEVSVGWEEREWSFTPKAPWKPGRHQLLVDRALEDLAGNGVGRPFEVDVFEGIARRIEPEQVTVLFEVAAATAGR